VLKYDQSELSARQDLIGKLAEAARSITLPLFKKDMAVVNKAEGRNYDPVTEADIEAERVMRELILSAFPYDSIEGEELSDIHGSNEWLWTLDPIDGTRGFVAGYLYGAHLSPLALKITLFWV
jgi:myo-inositol-1(or 4)-monophosphatase